MCAAKKKQILQDNKREDINGRLKRMDIVYLCKTCREKQAKEFRSKLLMREHIIKAHFSDLVTIKMVDVELDGPNRFP